MITWDDKSLVFPRWIEDSIFVRVGRWKARIHLCGLVRRPEGTVIDTHYYVDPRPIPASLSITYVNKLFREESFLFLTEDVDYEWVY